MPFDANGNWVDPSNPNQPYTPNPNAGGPQGNGNSQPSPAQIYQAEQNSLNGPGNTGGNAQGGYQNQLAQQGRASGNDPTASLPMDQAGTPGSGMWGAFEGGNIQAYSNRFQNAQQAMQQRQGVQLDPAAYSMMQQAAEGKAPSVAQQQQRQGIDAAAQSQLAIANSARGGAQSMAAAQTGAQAQGGAMQTQAVNQAAALRAQEMAQARGQFGQMAESQAGLSAQQRALNDAATQNYLQAEMGVNQARLQAGEAASGIAQGTAATQGAQNAQQAGAVASGVGTVLPLLATLNNTGGGGGQNSLSLDSNNSDIRGKTAIAPASQHVRGMLGYSAPVADRLGHAADIIRPAGAAGFAPQLQTTLANQAHEIKSDRNAAAMQGLGQGIGGVGKRLMATPTPAPQYVPQIPQAPMTWSDIRAKQNIQPEGGAPTMPNPQSGEAAPRYNTQIAQSQQPKPMPPPTAQTPAPPPPPPTSPFGGPAAGVTPGGMPPGAPMQAQPMSSAMSPQPSPFMRGQLVSDARAKAEAFRAGKAEGQAESMEAVREHPGLAPHSFRQEGGKSTYEFEPSKVPPPAGPPLPPHRQLQRPAAVSDFGSPPPTAPVVNASLPPVPKRGQPTAEQLGPLRPPVPDQRVATVPSDERAKSEVTQLAPEREKAFQEWAHQHHIRDLDDPRAHYDYRGAFEAHEEPKEGHWSDRFKQHGHPTFSIESRYSRGADDGGRWEGESYIPSDKHEKTGGRGALAESFLDSLHGGYSYRYKDPSMEPRSEPTGGRYLGVMAQDLEKSPVGRQLVNNTPQGKMLEGNALLSALAAGEGNLHERLKSIETMKHRKVR